MFAVAVRPEAGESLEAAARRVRHGEFARALSPGEMLLLAHHRDDQAETVLLRLLRGAGVHGLAAMAPVRPQGAGMLARPLLDVPRRAIDEYARRHGLVWVEDPSNQDAGFDRNFLRLQVLPRLAERWPGADATLARAAENASEAAWLLDELAAEDLAAVAAGSRLRLEPLRALSPRRQRNLLRYWIRAAGREVPDRARLEAGLDALLRAGSDRLPELVWPQGRIRRYRGELYLAQSGPPAPLRPIRWDLSAPLPLPDGRLEAVPAMGEGLRADLAGRADVSVRPRLGGERCRLAGRSHSQSLKKLLQEAGVAPDERGRLPLLYVGERLAAVADRWICEGFQAAPGGPGLRLVWHRE